MVNEVSGVLKLGIWEADRNRGERRRMGRYLGAGM